MKKPILLLLFLFFLTSIFGQKPTKITIDTSNVNFVKIIKLSGKPFKSSRKQLTKKQIFDFCIQWNKSKNLGADKFAGNYTIDIIGKDRTERRFTIEKNKIQESGNWQTFDFVDKKYFDFLWNGAK